MEPPSLSVQSSEVQPYIPSIVYIVEADRPKQDHALDVEYGDRELEARGAVCDIREEGQGVRGFKHEGCADLRDPLLRDFESPP